MDQKYFLSQSEGSIFANSTSCCSATGRKKELLILFFEKWTYQDYQDKFYIARQLYSVLTIVNFVFQYACLCFDV